jgi:hypothetical protein
MAMRPGRVGAHCVRPIHRVLIRNNGVNAGGAHAVRPYERYSNREMQQW